MPVLTDSVQYWFKGLIRVNKAKGEGVPKDRMPEAVQGYTAGQEVYGAWIVAWLASLGARLKRPALVH